MARIKGVDIPNEKRIVISLQYIYGIGETTAKNILKAIRQVNSGKGVFVIIKNFEADLKEFKKAIDVECLSSIEFAPNRYGALDGSDALILITEWKEFRYPDFDLLEEKLNQKIIFDGRNIYDKKIENLGFELFQIGC